MHRFLLSRLRARVIFVSTLAVFFAAPQSWGLGLGEIELDSALNQKFSATIELYDTSGLEPDEILVSLGSTEDFQRVGVERFFFLTDLQFEVTYGANGMAELRVTSSRPVTEPYLNFLVQILWPSGRMLKEYTVLLDPPTFSEAAAPVVSAPQQQREAAATSGRVQRQRVEPASSGTQVQIDPPSETQPSSLDQGFDGDEYGMTDRDDTLWSIASRGRPSGSVSVQQTMLAIQKLNPEAFIEGNINLLKAGYVLRMPNEGQARALSNSDAFAEVAQHEEAWQAYNRGDRAPRDTEVAAASTADDTSALRSPVDATAASPQNNSQTLIDGELRIVAEAGDSTTGVGSADLDAAREETDRLGRQVDELTYQLDREKDLATNELSVRDRQLEVKDQQILQLQSQLAAAQQSAAQQPPPATPAVEPTQNQNQSTSAQPEAAWWESPLVLYGGAGALVLLLVGGMVTARKRKAREEDEYYDSEEAFAGDERREPAFGAAAEFSDDDLDDDDLIDEDETRIAPVTLLGERGEDAEADEFTDAGDEEPLEGSQTSDVIGEADIYIAYGRFPQAIGLLLGVLEDEPERNDARLKLLEVYSETGDRGSFDEHMSALVEYCDEEDGLKAARELESQFGESAISLDEMIAEEEASTSVEETVEAEAAAGNLDLEFDTREASSDLEFSSSGADTADIDESADPSADDSQSAEGSHSAEGSDPAMDFELELDDLDDSAESNGEDIEGEAGAGDELGGDLGIDFDPDEDSATTEEQSVVTDSVGTDDRAAGGIDFEAPSSSFSSEQEEQEQENSIDESDEHESGGFGKMEEMTIDADLEEAAASISNENTEAGSAGEPALESGDLAVETDLDDASLDDLEFEAVTTADDDFEFQDEGDSANTKLDLARAYIDMGDADGARDILKEVMGEGNSDQQQKAQAMLESI